MTWAQVPAFILSTRIESFVREYSSIAVYVFIGITIVVIIVDIILVTNDIETGDTISNIIRDWAYGKGAVLAFIWGVLAGHFFLIDKKSITPEYGWFIILGMVLILLLIGLILKPRISALTLIILLTAGIAASFIQLI